MMATTTSTSNDQDGTSSPLTVGVPNWRVFSGKGEKETDDNDDSDDGDNPNESLPATPERMGERSPWSEEQYKESLELYEKLMSCNDSYVSPGIQNALSTLAQAYRLYGPHSVICSFNGGKDAVVILHLVRAAHASYYYNLTGSTDTTPIRPRVVYFDHEHEFPEVIDFVRQSVQDYDLDMVAFEKGVKFSAGLQTLVQTNILPGCNRPFPMGFVLGTRSSDPNAGGQDHFAPSSTWMPPFMRVNPILDWNYGHVWHFLRLFQMPYCSLYDLGYTSLGTTQDTRPCPALAVNRGEEQSENGDGGITTATQTESVSGQTESRSGGLPKFWPAYMLRDWDQERAGRTKKGGKDDKEGAKRIPKTTIPRTVSTLSTTSDLRKSDPKMTTTTVSTSAGVAADGSSTYPSAPASECGSTRPFADDSTAFTMDSDDGEQKTVGILIIGDEILKGLTVDQNTNAAAKALRKECVCLSRVVVISDDQDEIVKEIRRLQGEVDVVITSGGVGPTHDDVTIKSVAASLNSEMLFHSEMAAMLKEKMNNGTNPLTPAQIKMATLPSNAKLRYLSENKDDWPVLQCKNIFILPGVPQFFAKKIESVAAYLSSQLERGAAYKVVLSVDEASIVDTLNDIVARHPNVTFGSYPFVSHPEYKTVLTLEGTLIEADDKAYTNESNMKNTQPIPVPSNRTGGGGNFRNSILFDRNALIMPKATRDRYVRLALDDLINRLPKGSILRVENDDLTPFS